MNASNLKLSNDEFLHTTLAPRIRAHVNDWYGLGAELSGSPSFQTREWSFFVRYPIHLSGGSDKVILVKIRRGGLGMSLQDAMFKASLGDESRKEYQMLARIKQIITESRDAFLFSINPLTCYADLNALVIEEADIHPLKAYFKSPNIWIKSRRRAFELLLERAGRWLHLYHDRMGNATEGTLFGDAFHANAVKNLQDIESADVHHNLQFARNLLDELHTKYKNSVVSYRTLHYDFNCANIFVTREGKIGSLDPKNSSGPVYIDIAKFVMDFETSKNQVLTNRLGAPFPMLKLLEKAFLEGYLGQYPLDAAALDLYRIMALIEKWHHNEVKLRQMTNKQRALYFLAVLQMRGYFSRLLHHHVEHFRKSHT